MNDHLRNKCPTERLRRKDARGSMVAVRSSKASNSTCSRINFQGESTVRYHKHKFLPYSHLRRAAQVLNPGQGGLPPEIPIPELDCFAQECPLFVTANDQTQGRQADMARRHRLRTCCAQEAQSSLCRLDRSRDSAAYQYSQNH